MKDKDFIKTKRKLDRMTADLMIVQCQVQDLVASSLELGEVLQNYFKDKNEKNDN